MAQMFVKPGIGPDPDGKTDDNPDGLIPLKVRDPVTRRFLPAQGGWVPRNKFWMRLVADKDVVETDPPAPVTEAEGQHEVVVAAEPAAAVEAPTVAEEH